MTTTLTTLSLTTLSSSVIRGNGEGFVDLLVGATLRPILSALNLDTAIKVMYYRSKAS